MKLGHIDADVLKSIAPTEPGAATWIETLDASTFPGSSRLDQVIDFGWNLKANGLVATPGEAAVGLQFESFYSPSVGREFMEHHLVFIANDGSYYRPQSWMFDRNTGAIEGYIQADLFQYYDGQRNEWFSLNPGYMAIYNGFQLRNIVNDRLFLTQLNAEATTNLSLMYLNAADQVVIGVGSTLSSSVSAAGIVLGAPGSETNVQGALVANETATLNGTTTVNGNTLQNGAVQPHRTAIADADYALASNDYLVAYTSLSQNRTVRASGAGSPQNPIYVVIKDESGRANSSSAISFSVPGGTIDGASSLVLVDHPYGVAHIYCTGPSCYTY